VCTAAGCESEISVSADDLAYARTDVTRLRVCIDGRCTTRSRYADGRISVSRRIGGTRPLIAVATTLIDAEGLVVASDHRWVKRRRSAPNGESCGPVCFIGAAHADQDGRLQTRPIRGRMPSPSPGRVRVDVIVRGRVTRLEAGRSPPRAVRVRRGDQVEVRTDARSYVRVFAPGRRPPPEYEWYEFSYDRAGRVWIEEIPRRLRGVRHLVVRLDRRADRRNVELRLPVEVMG